MSRFDLKEKQARYGKENKAKGIEKIGFSSTTQRKQKILYYFSLTPFIFLLFLTSFFRRKVWHHNYCIYWTILSAKAAGDAKSKIFHVRDPVKSFRTCLGKRKTTHRTSLNTHIARDTGFFIKNWFGPRCRFNPRGNVSLRIQYGLFWTNSSTDPTLDTGFWINGMDFPFLPSDGLRRTFISTN